MSEEVNARSGHLLTVPDGITDATRNGVAA